MTDIKGEYVRIDSAAAKAVVGLLVMSCSGPDTAYATLILALKMLFYMNTDQTGETHTDEEIIEEFAVSWRSIRSARYETHN